MPNTPELVTVQFSFTGSPVLGFCLNATVLNPETPEAKSQRQDRRTGQAFLQKQGLFSLANLFPDLSIAQYVFTKAEKQQRIGKIGPYWMIRYVFARQESQQEMDRTKRAQINDAWEQLGKMSLWKHIRGYQNPLYREGIEVPGAHTLCICAEARQPLLEPNGKFVTQWETGTASKRVGDYPLPLQPSHQVRFDLQKNPQVHLEEFKQEAFS